MEMGIRGWMLVIGGLLVLAVLLDGYRRVRNERKGNLRVSLNMGGGFDRDSDDEIANHELPNGGARVKNRDEESRRQLEQKMADRAVAKSSRRRSAGAGTQRPSKADSRVEPTLDGSGLPGSGSDSDRQEPSLGQPPLNPRLSAVQNQDQDVLMQPRPARTDARNHTDIPARRAGDQNREVLLVYAKAPEGQCFDGPDLMRILLACDLRMGDKSILHRFEEADGQGAVQFSVANMLEPGTFDLNSIDSFNTPGVVFFLTFPGPDDVLTAFDYMVEVAQCVVNNLGGTLYDESHQPFDEHLKESLRRGLSVAEKSVGQPA